MSDSSDSKDLVGFINWVGSLASIFKGYPCVTVDKLSELEVGDWLIYRCKNGWYSHMYVTHIDDSGNVVVTGMFRVDDDEIECELLRVKLVVRELVLNYADFEMIRLAKMVGCSHDEKLESRRMSEFKQSFEHYSLRSCNSEHLLSFVKKGIRASSQIQTLVAHLSKQFVKEGIRVGSKELVKFAIDVLTWPAKGVTAFAKRLASAKGIFKDVINHATENASKGGVFKQTLKIGAAIEIIVCTVDIAWSAFQWFNGEMSFHQLRCHTVRRVSSGVGSVVGGAGGVWLGGWLGAFIGSAIPVVGTVAGAAFGSILGGIVGGVVGALAGTRAGEGVNGVLDQCEILVQ